MVERYLINYDERGEVAHPSGDFVHYSDYARLQEQVETLRKERDRLREMTLRAADQCDKWVKETYDGGWSTRQVLGQCALAESLRLAALQKEHQP